MSLTKPPTKSPNYTSIIKHTSQQHSEDLNIDSNIKPASKIQPKTSPQSSNLVVNTLLGKLSFMQERLKQNQQKFLDCIRSLQSQIASKDQINHSLKEQITSLKQQLTQVKSHLDTIQKNTDSNLSLGLRKKSETKILKSSIQKNPFRLIKPQLLQKQNLNPYMIDTLCSSRHPKKLSQALAKAQETNCEKNQRLHFKMEDFLQQSKAINVDEYYHHHKASGGARKSEQSEVEKRTIRLKNSLCTRKGKSKSIGGIVKGKIFLK